MLFLEWILLNFDWFFNGAFPFGSMHNMSVYIQTMTLRNKGLMGLLSGCPINVAGYFLHSKHESMLKLSNNTHWLRMWHLFTCVVVLVHLFRTTFRCVEPFRLFDSYPDSNVYGPTWGPPLSDPSGLHVGPINLAIRVVTVQLVSVPENGPLFRSEAEPSLTQIARFMGPTWVPPGDDRTQVGPMLAPWTLLSGCFYFVLSPHVQISSLGSSSARKKLSIHTYARAQFNVLEIHLFAARYSGKKKQHCGLFSIRKLAYDGLAKQINQGYLHL